MIVKERIKILQKYKYKPKRLVKKLVFESEALQKVLEEVIKLKAKDIYTRTIYVSMLEDRMPYVNS